MSWMIVSRTTGKSVFEAKSQEVLNCIDLNAYIAVPSADYLEEIAQAAEALPEPRQVEGLHTSLSPAAASLRPAGNCPGRVPNTSHHSRIATGAPFSLDEARCVVRQPNRSDEDIKAACGVLRERGDHQDDWIVSQIERAIEQSQNMIEVA